MEDLTMKATKQELKNIDMVKVFDEEKHLNIIITDGRHTIHNVNGKLKAVEKNALSATTRTPKYIQRKIDEYEAAK